MRASSTASSPFVVAFIVLVGACVSDEPVPTPADDGRDGGSSGPEIDGSTLPDGGTTSDSGALPDGGASCAAPLADCNGDGACETSLESDPKNCGTCGRGCGAGAACADKVCQPVTLATGLKGAVSAAVNASALVILKDGGPAVCPKDGCGAASPTNLASGEFFPAAPHTIYVDANDAYWLGRQTATGTRYELRKCAIAGCGLAPTTIDEEQTGSEMRGDGGALLRYDPTGLLTKIYLDGTTKKEDLSLATRPSSNHFALANGKMAFSNTDGATGGNAGVWFGDFANKNPVKIMNEGNWVAIANGSVFASRADDDLHDAIYGCAFEGCGGVGKKLGGGAANGTGKIADMAADASGVYWVETTGQIGRVMRCKLPDCADGPEELAVAQNKPVAITLDDKFVYWVNAGSSPDSGAVLRVAK